MSIICIIPARGGSKGLPNKNILELNEIPLVAHSIIAAKNSKLVDEVYVSTDDELISKISLKYGSQVIDRPYELSSDTATSESALLHALSKIEDIYKEIEYIVFLQCTSPLRKQDEIDSALLKIKNEGSDSLLSVVNFHRFIWINQNDSIVPINYDYKNRTRRQDSPLQFAENGSIYIFKPWVLKELNNRLGGKISYHIMEDDSYYEIDTKFDFSIIECLISNKKNII